METSLEQIREQQKQSWNKFSPGWKKWNNLNMVFLKPMGDAIIDSLQIQDTNVVLDIATGTGEPGITIAGLVPNGKVVGTDLAENMLTIARENADAKGLKNYETITADVCELPFAPEFFDAISCRMGFMFFPDMQLAADEMYRVLKTGGRIAVTVWGAPEFNNWVTTIMNVIRKHIELPTPMPGAPGMFRCAPPALMTNILKQAGFKHIKEDTITGKMDYKSFDLYWEMMLEVGAPVVAALANADDATEALIKKETAELFRSKNKIGEAIMDYQTLTISGEK